MDIEIAVQVIINGVMLGGVYALASMGLALVFGVMRTINMAHGGLIVLGSTITFKAFSDLGAPPYVAVWPTLLALLLLGVLIQAGLLERLQRSEELTTLILLFGLSMVLHNVVLLWGGGIPFSVPFWSGPVRLGNYVVSRTSLYSFIAALLISAGLFWFLSKAHWGRAIRATAMAPDLAGATGINTGRVRSLTFGIGGALAGLSGVLLVTSSGVTPEAGVRYLLIAFAAAVIGGLGSLPGAFVAALLLALVQVTAGILWDSQIAEMALYLSLLVTMLIRPTGLFGVGRL